MEHFYPIEFYSTFASLKNGYTSSQAAAASALSMAERSYPMSEVKGSGLECQAAMAQEWPRGATPHTRSGAAAERSYPVSEARDGGREESPCGQGQGRPRAVAKRRNPMPEAKVVTGRSNHMPKAKAAAGGATPHPRSGGCMGTGGPRGAIPR